MSEWREEDGERVRDFKFSDFAAAMAFEMAATIDGLA